MIAGNQDVDWGNKGLLFRVTIYRQHQVNISGDQKIKTPIAGYPCLPQVLAFVIFLGVEGRVPDI
jgi:hypothetical protein